MQKIGISILLLFGMLNLVPPLFAEGGIFDVTYTHYNGCGESILYHGLYFDNAYFTILYAAAAWVCFTIPFVFKLSKSLNRVAFVFSSWNIAGLIFEIINIFSPELAFNSDGSNMIYTQYILLFTLSMASIITFETWSKLKKSEN